MALTVVNNLTQRHALDNTTGVTAVGVGSSLATDTDVFKEGTGSAQLKVENGRGGIQVVVTSFDFTDGVIYVWVVSDLPMSDVADTGGLTIRLGSSTTDWEEWQVTLGSQYPGGFQRFAVQDGVTPNTTNGTFNKAAVTHVTIQADVPTDIMGNIDTFRVDSIDHLNRSADTTVKAITVTGTVATPGQLFEEIRDNATQAPTGIVVQGAGAINLNGPIEIGGTTAQDDMSALDTRVIWNIQAVLDTLYELEFLGNATQTHDYEFGQKLSATLGARGPIITTGGPLWALTAIGVDIDTFLLYGCIFTGLRDLKLGDGTTQLGGTGDTVELITNKLSGLKEFIKDVAAATILYFNNTIEFGIDYRSSIDIRDGSDVLASEFALIQASGFIQRDAEVSSTTYDLKDHDFETALVPYVNLTDADEIWDIINPNWTLETGKQKQVDFADVPTITVNGTVLAAAMVSNEGNARNSVRASNGDLYVVTINSGDIEIMKSVNDGGTWTGPLDDANSPTTGATPSNPSCAIDSAGLIHMIWHDGATTDEIRHSTFATSTDQWNAGGAAVENTVRSGVTTASRAYSIAIDSQDTAHVVYYDQTINDLFYNNDIDFSTNEVSLNADAGNLSAGQVDIAIRPSDDIPIVSAFINRTTDVIEIYEGNARDATSFTTNALIVPSDDGFDTSLLSAGLAVADNDTMLVAISDTLTDRIGVYRKEPTDAFADAFTFVLVSNAEMALTFRLTICANNNRIYICDTQLTDDEIQYWESKNYGIGWTPIKVVTTTTTSSRPILRACHGLHEGEPHRVDIIYRDSTSQPQHAELANLGLAGDIRELFEILLTAKEPDGTLVFTAREKLVEANPTPALANEASTGAAGQQVIIEYLRRLLEPNDTTGGLTVADHNPTIVKSYKYGKLPFVTNLGTIAAKQTLDAIHLVDDFQVESNPATAITLGDTTNDVQVELQTNSATLFKFTGGSGVDPTPGDTIGNNLDAAEGVFLELVEGDFVAGTMLLDTRNATAWPTAAHTVDDAASAGNWTATFTAASLRNFKWLVDAATLTPQQLYDYFNAKFDEATLDTAVDKIMDQVAIWGRAEHGLPIQGATLGSPNLFQTVRNVALTEGWMVYNIGGVGLSGFTQFIDDAGTAFVPAATVTLTVTVLEAEDQTAIVGARVYIGRQSDNSELLNDVTNGSGVVSASFTYTVDVDVFIRVRQETEIYQRLAGTITSTGLTITVLLPDDNQYTPT